MRYLTPPERVHDATIRDEFDRYQRQRVGRVEPELRVDQDRLARPDVRGVLPLVQVSPPGERGGHAGGHGPPA